jgi:hypothetical protein
VQGRPGKELAQVDSVAAHEQAALPLEGRREGCRAAVGQRRAPTLDLDRGDPAPGQALGESLRQQQRGGTEHHHLQRPAPARVLVP